MIVSGAMDRGSQIIIPIDSCFLRFVFSWFIEYLVLFAGPTVFWAVSTFPPTYTPASPQRACMSNLTPAYCSSTPIPFSPFSNAAASTTSTATGAPPPTPSPPPFPFPTAEKNVEKSAAAVTSAPPT